MIKIEQWSQQNDPKASKWSQTGTQWRQDGTQSSLMEPKVCPMASKLRQKGTQGGQSRAQSWSKPSKWSPKGSHGDQNGAQSEPREVIRCQLAAKYGGFFWAFWVQIPSIIASKTDAKINAEKVVEISCETMLKSMRNLLKFIEIQSKTL